jgi:hypothetical protein
MLKFHSNAKDPCKKCDDPFDFTCYLISVDIIRIICETVEVVGTFAAYSPHRIKFFKTKYVKRLYVLCLQLTFYTLLESITHKQTNQLVEKLLQN